MEFDLRTDVKFHDGTPLTAEDVAFSAKRITNPALKSSALSQFDQIVDAKAEGPGKVVLTTKTPYPVLLAQLVKLSIVPKAYVERVGDQTFNLRPIGSGPYKLREWQKGVQVTLDANDGYWRGKPPFKTVMFRAVPDVSTRVADLKTSRADLIRLLPPDEAIALKKEPGISVLTVPTERVGYSVHQCAVGRDRRSQGSPGHRLRDRQAEPDRCAAAGPGQAGQQHGGRADLRLSTRHRRLWL